MPVRERGALVPGETVVVLGASGVVGQVAMRAARAGGAGRIVAVARRADGRERALALGADVALPTGEGLAEALREACGDGADLVVDALWGDSAAAAIGALRRGARARAGGQRREPGRCRWSPGPCAGGGWTCCGFSVLVEEPAEVAPGLPRADRGRRRRRARRRSGHRRVPLDDAPAAWARQAAGTGGRKLVVRL